MRGGLRQPDRCRLVLFFFLNTSLAIAQAGVSSEQRANHYLAGFRKQLPLVLPFLHDMPKGGDLHNHLGGAIDAEDLINFAAQDKLCVENATFSLLPGSCDSSCDKGSAKRAVDCAYHDQDFYNSIVDAWSMRNWEHGRESGHDHFFATFSKFGPALDNHYGEAIADAMNQAAADHLEYLELMHTVDGLNSAGLGARVGWDPNFRAMRDKLLFAGLKDRVREARSELDREEQIAHTKLACETPTPRAGCEMRVRYLYQVLRGLPPEQVLAQILTGFELASSDPRVVGLNLVMPEDWYLPMRDFDLHMKVLNYLHELYPKVHISLHAGELAPGLVTPDGLSFHIRESVEVGHAERIGHGVDVMNERDPVELLHEMAQRRVLIETCLTSNDEILGVKGDDHPFPIYRHYKVPVALATDDEGVSRSDLTHEYLRAFETYNLTYSDLKEMARQSLEHSFLPGASLWADTSKTNEVAQCAGVHAESESAACKKFLDANEKARVQWKLEQEFAAFEKKF